MMSFLFDFFEFLKRSLVPIVGENQSMAVSLSVFLLLLFFVFARWIWQSSRRQSSDKAKSSSSKTYVFYPPPISSDPNDASIIKQGFSPRKIPPQDENNPYYDAIVIGSGIGGLTVASILSQYENCKVLVLEQHDVAGGSTHTFEEKGYEFDTGLHYIGGKVLDKQSPSRKLFDMITRNQVQWQPMDPVFDKLTIADTSLPTSDSDKDTQTKHVPCRVTEFPVRGNVTQVRADLKKLFPDEEKAIDLFFAHVRNAKIIIPVMFLLKWYRVPQFLVRPMYWFLFNYCFPYMKQSTAQELDSLTDNVELKGILGYCFGTYSESLSHGCFLIHTLIWDGFCVDGGGAYPVGGSRVLAKAMVPIIESAGGHVFVRAPVTKILLNDRGTRAVGVQVKSEHCVYAPNIISNVGFSTTVNKLIRKTEMNPKVKRQWELQVERPILSQPRCKTSFMTLFVGLDTSEQDPLYLPSGNHWIYPSWDHENNLKRYDPRSTSSQIPLAFVSFPSSKDPDYGHRHPDKQVALVTAGCDYSVVAQFENERVKHRSSEYQVLKEHWKQQLLHVLIQQYPHIESHITFTEMSTPVSYNYYLGSFHGAMYGLAHSYNRFQIPCLDAKTPLPGLFMSGQDVFTAGIEGALAAGLLCTAATPLASASTKRQIMANMG